MAVRAVQTYLRQTVAVIDIVDDDDTTFEAWNVLPIPGALEGAAVRNLADSYGRRLAHFLDVPLEIA